jgi:hypothetical protein
MHALNFVLSIKTLLFECDPSRLQYGHVCDQFDICFNQIGFRSFVLHCPLQWQSDSCVYSDGIMEHVDRNLILLSRCRYRSIVSTLMLDLFDMCFVFLGCCGLFNESMEV